MQSNVSLIFGSILNGFFQFFCNFYQNIIYGNLIFDCENRWYFKDFHFLFSLMLGCFLDWFLFNFLLILGPKIHEKWIKIGIKINTKSNKKLIGFLIDFWSILGRFWEGFGSQNRSKIDQNGISKMIEKLMAKKVARADARNLAAGPLKDSNTAYQKG